MTEFRRRTLRRPAAAALGLVALALAGCTTISVPGAPDLIGQTDAPPRQPTAERPEPDARGVISYPTYQVAVAREGDTVTSIAQRLGLDASALASVNGLPANAPLNPGEIVLLNQRVAASTPSAGVAPAGTEGGLAAGGAVDVATLAGSALDRAEGQPAAASPSTTAATPAPTTSPAPKAAPAKPAAAAKTATGTEPVRHVVKRGETAYSIARMYNITVRSLADWNGLDAKMTVREGQTLLIPTSTGPAPKTAVVTAPGSGSPTPEPPSAAEPQPEDEAPKAQPAAQTAGGASGSSATAAAPAKTDTAPVVAAPQTKASDTARLAQPVAGKIVSPYKPGANEGVDFGAPSGAPVKAAEAGTVAAITQDTDQVPIIVIRHANGLLTVYANVDDITVEKGTTVARGQTIASVGGGSPSVLHFEVREGFDSVDPVDYLSD